MVGSFAQMFTPEKSDEIKELLVYKTEFEASLLSALDSIEMNDYYLEEHGAFFKPAEEKSDSE